jgi:poly(A)-specific ribonuclease
VEKMSKDVRKIRELAFKDAEDEEAFNTLLGFSRFMRLLVDKRVPVVGHNLLLDLMMMFQQFIEPLPGIWCILVYHKSSYFIA